MIVINYNLTNNNSREEHETTTINDSDSIHAQKYFNSIKYAQDTTNRSNKYGYLSLQQNLTRKGLK